MHAAEAQEEEVQALIRVARSGQFAQGAEVEALEDEFAAYVGTRYAVAVGSGEAALHFALRARGVGPGNEVITSPLASVAVFRAIHAAGAAAMLAEVGTRTYTLKPDSVEACIGPRTRAILPVHQFGCPCDMWSLMSIAERHGLPVVEDARRATGAAWGGRKVGGFGDGCFSFTDGDVLSAGEGGMVTTDSAIVADEVRALRTSDYYSCELETVSACGSRMSGLAAALCKTRLRWLDEDIAARTTNAHLLTEGLKDITTLVPPLTPPHASHIYHRYAVRLLPDHPMAPADVTAALRRLGMDVDSSDSTLLKYRDVFTSGAEQPDNGPRWGPLPEDLPRLAPVWRLMNSLVFLPMHASISAEDTDKMLTTMRLLAFRIPRDGESTGIAEGGAPQP
jgi:dTDP-4-amino-4,6-dideoxygalactose transaminase